MINNSKRYESLLNRDEMLLLDKCKNQYMIGRLRNDEYSTYVTEQGNVQFFVNELCEEPKPVLQLYNKLVSDDGEPINGDYIGFDDKQPNIALPLGYDLFSYNDEEKSEDIKNYYKNKLLIFTPKYNFNTKNGKWFKNLFLVNVYETDTDLNKAAYSMAPRVQKDPKSFEKELENGTFFDLNNYDSTINDSPDYILCGSYAYKVKVGENNPFEASVGNAERWKCVDYSLIEKIDYTKTKNFKVSKIVRASDNIVFVEEDLNNEIMIATTIVPFEKDRTKVAESIDLKSNSTSTDEIDDNGEFEFINALEQMTLNNGLQYEFNDLLNFHTSIKTSPLVILSGMSGTGKSRLAMNYAKMLGLSEDNRNLLFMPISPSYTEPSDVLGYLNSMNGLYIPSETGLVQFLLHAKENTDQMHMVVFDEMNLSQVEYWFSPFISLLEKEPEEQILRLYDDDAHCINEKVYPPTIKIGENILFVGTVNVDDTTKNFSDRLLDRTFVINLDKVSFTDFYKQYTNYKGKDHADLTTSKCKNVTQFKSWVKSDNINYMQAFENHNEELQFFDELDSLIQKYIPNGGISHRVMKNIGNYLLNVPGLEDRNIKHEDMFDTVVNQTILTKIRGTETQLQNLIGQITSEDNTLVNSELIELLNKYNSLGEFTKVRTTLKNKAEELRINGFAN